MKKNILAIVTIISIMFVSCVNNVNNEKKQESKKNNILQVDDVLANPESLIDKEIEMEGICTHRCKHSGKRIFMMGTDDSKTIRIESAKLGSFDQECLKKVLKVKGVLREERIDEAYLQQWEASVAETNAEEHGHAEAGCDTEKAARGETANTTAERIADFRKKIADRNEAEGKNYLSFYYMEAISYEIQKQ